MRVLDYCLSLFVVFGFVSCSVSLRIMEKLRSTDAVVDIVRMFEISGIDACFLSPTVSTETCPVNRLMSMEVLKCKTRDMDYYLSATGDVRRDLDVDVKVLTQTECNIIYTILYKLMLY
jgi:hypothetical protein